MVPLIQKIRLYSTTTALCHIRITEPTQKQEVTMLYSSTTLTAHGQEMQEFIKTTFVIR